MFFGFSEKRQTSKMINAISSNDWETVSSLIGDGFNPNREFSTEKIAHIRRQKATHTTPLLALSMHSVRDDGSKRLLSKMLRHGGNPFFTAKGDKRNALVHFSNIRDLDGWKIIADHGVDLRLAVLEYIPESWKNGANWAHEYRAELDTKDLVNFTPPATSVRKSPRL